MCLKPENVLLKDIRSKGSEAVLRGRNEGAVSPMAIVFWRVWGDQGFVPWAEF